MAGPHKAVKGIGIEPVYSKRELFVWSMQYQKWYIGMV